MMSLLTLSGFAFGGLLGDADADAESHAEDQDYLFEHERWSAGADLPDLAQDDFAAEHAGAPADGYETLEFSRGEELTGFDTDSDVLELEYAKALGPPDVTVTDFADGTGASVALNGVVVADVVGAQGLCAEDVVLVPT